ncbi:MAG TPA: FecR domain-containing protein [Rhizomicrobium sp.]|nr:FecR domain-containing protein [Rhizomicrobium sp.]
MSGGSEQSAPAIRLSGEVEERAAAYVVARRDRDDWSESDQAALDAWVAQSMLHRVAYLRLEAAWARADRVRALRQARPVGDVRGHAGLFRRLVAGAAIVTGISVAIYLAIPQAPVARYATAIGGHKIVKLGDGTQIELNTDTAIRVLVNREQRKVWLDRGEAFFRVAHDPAHPFVVEANQRRVTVLGTKFSMRRDGDVTDVALFEGRVRFDPKGEGARAPVELVPGDTVRATSQTLTLARRSQKAMSDSVAWQRGVVVFDRTPLADAARQFNRYNSEKIIIADEQTGKITIGGTFQTDNIAGFARVAHSVLGLHVQIRPGETIISQ